MSHDTHKRDTKDTVLTSALSFNFDPITLRTAKTLLRFGHSECNRFKFAFVDFSGPDIAHAKLKAHTADALPTRAFLFAYVFKDNIHVLCLMFTCEGSFLHDNH